MDQGQSNDMPHVPLSCELKEYEKWTKTKGELQRQEDRKIRIINNASSHFFSVSLDLKGVDATDLKEKYFFPHLSPGTTREETYETKQESPPLKIDEHIQFEEKMKGTVLPAREEKHLKFMIEVENNTDTTFSDVRLTRVLPEQIEVKKGATRCDEGTIEEVIEGVLLSLEELESHESIQLEIPAVFYSEKNEPVKLGGMEAVFSPKKPISGVEISNIEGKAALSQNVQKTEREAMFSWDLTWEIENKNDFPLRCSGHIDFQSEIKNYEKQQNLNVKEDKAILETVRIDAGNSISLGPFTLQSKERPQYETEVKGKASGTVKYDLRGEYKEDRPSVPILDGQIKGKRLTIEHTTDLEEYLQENEILDIEKARLNLMVGIENRGSAGIGWVRFKETLPQGFKAPKEITCFLREKRINEKDYTWEVKPDDAGPEQDRVLVVEVANVEPYGGPLRKGERVALRYSTQSTSSIKQDQASFPSKVDLSTEKGNLTQNLSLVEDNVPSVMIKKARRAVSVKQDIQPTGEDRFKVIREMKNESPIPIPGYSFQVHLPKNFKLVDSNIQPTETTETEEGTRTYTWKLEERIPPNGGTYEVWYECEGRGKYRVEDLLKMEHD